MTAPCPFCSGTRTLAVADHYLALVGRAEADPAAAAPFAPPLSRSVWTGTLALTLGFLAALTPGFVAPERALATGLGFGALGALALAAWRRARRADQRRLDAYRQARVCLDCGKFNPCP